MQIKKWQEMTPADKVKFLDEQIDQIKRCMKLLKRFERLSERWLKNAQAQAKKK